MADAIPGLYDGGAGAAAASGHAGSSRRIWVALAVVSAAAMGIRAVFVGDQSLGYEEVFTASIVGHTTVGGVWGAIRSTESTPPLYYLLTWLWVRLAGDQSAVALRMVSVLAGVGTVPAVFLAARYFVSDRVALAAAWLCAVSPLLIEYSLYARSYALFVFVIALSLLAVGRVATRPSVRGWVAWGLAASACLWTHYFAAFVLVGEVGVLWVALPGERRRLVVCAAGVIASFIPLLSLFRAQSGASSRTAFITARPLRSRLADVVRQFSMGTNVPTAWLEACGIVLVVGAVAVGVTRTPGRGSARALAAIAVVGAGLPIAAALAGVADFLLPRNIIGAWLCMAPLAAYGLTRARAVPLAAYSGICLATALIVQTNWRYQGSTDWSGASERIEAAASGQPVAVVPAMEVSVAALYLHRAPLAGMLQTRDLWVMVEPIRGSHQRALAPDSAVPLQRYWSPQLRAVKEIDYRGFRLIDLRSGAPVAVAPAASGPAGPSAVVLAP
jgi:hypothetical protein